MEVRQVLIEGQQASPFLTHGALLTDPHLAALGANTRAELAVGVITGSGEARRVASAAATWVRALDPDTDAVTFFTDALSEGLQPYSSAVIALSGSSESLTSHKGPGACLQLSSDLLRFRLRRDQMGRGRARRTGGSRRSHTYVARIRAPIG
jgi:hypothetical protein